MNNISAAPLKKPGRGNTLRGAAGAAAGILVLYFVLRSCDWRQAGDAFRQADLSWAALALFLIIFQFFIKGWRLMALSEGRWTAQGPYTESVVLGLGANSFIPLRAGEFFKIAYMVRKAGNSILQAALSVVVERILDVAFMAVLLASVLISQKNLFIVWFEKMRPSLEAKASLAVTGGVGVLAVTLAFIFVWLSDLRGLRTRFSGKIKEMLAKLEEIRLQGGHRLGAAVFLTVLVWSLDSVFLYSMTRSFDLGVSFRHIFFLQLVLTASYASSVSPGALGLYEFLGLWALKTLEKPEAASLACLLATHGLVFAVMGAGTLFVLLKGFWTSPKALKET